MIRRMVHVTRHIVAMPHDSDADTAEDSSSSSSSCSNEMPAAADECDEHEVLEPWVEWIQRATHLSEGMARNSGVSDWVQTQKKRYFAWAGHVARREDGRWSRRVLDWTPSGGKRSCGHPKQRWIDKLAAFVKNHTDVDWKAATADRHTWGRWADEFSCTA
jgi:hypothetical protein